MIIINGEGWMVMRVPPSHPALVDKIGPPALGCCDDISKIIYFSSALKPWQIRRVLCHEIVHAYMYSYDIIMDDYTEEQVASVIDTYGEEILVQTNLIYNSFK